MFDFDVDTVDFDFVTFAVDGEDFADGAFVSAIANDDLVATNDVPALEWELEFLVGFEAHHGVGYSLEQEVHYLGK